MELTHQTAGHASNSQQTGCASLSSGSTCHDIICHRNMLHTTYFTTAQMNVLCKLQHEHTHYTWQS